MRSITVCLVLFVLLSLAACSPAPDEAAAPGTSEEFVVYVGTYTHETSEGIYAFRFDASTGEMSPPELVSSIESPSFLTIHPNRRFLYAVSETKDGSVTAFSFDQKSPQLTKLNTVSAHGDLPCHLNVDKTGSTLAIANYSTGNVVSYPIKSDGSLQEAASIMQHEGTGFNPRQQPGPLAHSADFSPDNRFLLVSDKGLDRIYIYAFDPADSSLEPNDPPFAEVKPGSGPRHFVFHPTGRYGYVINELASTVTAFSYDASGGVLDELQTIPALPEDYSEPSYAAEIAIHPSGRFLYGSNRGHDSIAVFSVNADTGALDSVEYASTGGSTPRNFAIDPTGRYLLAANQQSDTVVLYQIDSETGRLTPTGDSLAVDAPVCLQFLAR